MELFMDITPKSEADVESVHSCKFCLAPESVARLTRRDLTVFYYAFRPCGLQVDSKEPHYVWVCQYCWVRASQCYSFIDSARNAQRILNLNEPGNSLNKQLYPYSVSRIENTTACKNPKCLQTTHAETSHHEIKAAEPEFLSCDQVDDNDTKTDDVKLEKHDEYYENENTSCMEPEVQIDIVRTTPNVNDAQKHSSASDDEDSLFSNASLIEIKAKMSKSAPTKGEGASRYPRRVRSKPKRMRLKKKPQLPKRTQIPRVSKTKATKPRTFPGKKVETAELNVRYNVEFIPYAVEDQREEIQMKKQTEVYRRRKHKCGKCGQAFNEEESYEKHVRKWHDEAAGAFECQICYYRFRKERLLRQHTYAHGRRWRCLGCGYVLSRVQLEAHHGSCGKPQPADCKICGNTLQSHWHLKVHIRNQHKSAAKKFVCDTCGKAFRFKSHIRDHIRSHTGFKPYVCESCGKSSTSAILHQAHMRTHTQKEQRDDSYCVECDVYFKTKYLLHNHLNQSLNHVSKMTYKHECNMCDERFIQPSQLRNHIDIVHFNKRQFQCTLCGKAYFTKGVLKTHMRSKHTVRTRDHICNVCGKAFMTKKTLNQHSSAIHMKERPYKCEFCNATFGYPGALFTHNKLRHKVPKKEGRRPEAPIIPVPQNLLSLASGKPSVDTLSPIKPESSLSMMNLSKPESSVNTMNLSKPDTSLSMMSLSKPDSSLNMMNLTKPDSSLSMMSLSKPDSSLNMMNLTKPDNSLSMMSLTKPVSSLNMMNLTKPDSSFSMMSLSKQEHSLNMLNLTKPDSLSLMSLSKQDNSLNMMNLTSKPESSLSMMSAVKPKGSW